MTAKELIDKICEKSLFGVKGYTEEEIQFIENLYDIKVKGELKEFLVKCGRSSGCKFKDIGYEYYFNLWISKNVRKNILSNAGLKDEIIEIAFNEMNEQKQYSLEKHRYYKYISGKPFHICTENQTQELFILTVEDEHLVYRYDTNYDSIFSTNQTFIEYVNSLIDWEGDVDGTKNWYGEYVVPKYT